MRLACKKLTVEVDDSNRIVEFVDVSKDALKPY